MRQVKCGGDEELQKGLEEAGLAEAHNSRLHSLTVGLDHACVIVSANDGTRVGKGVCWGSNWLNEDMNEGLYKPNQASSSQLVFVGKSVAREGPLVAISAGTEHTCAVTQGGELQCWGLSNVRDTGIPSGNHWLAVKAAHMRTCAVSLVGGGVLACWGATGRVHLEAINSQALRMCPAASVAGSGPTARVLHYGPDLSSLDHYDGSWLQVLPAQLLLHRDPFVTILSPEVSLVLTPSESSHGWGRSIRSTQLQGICISSQRTSKTVVRAGK